MLYVKFLFLNLLLIYNYYYLFYVFIFYGLKYFVNNCIENYYWLDTYDFNIYVFGNMVYLSHFIYYNTPLKRYSNKLYNYIFYLNCMIEIYVKYNLLDAPKEKKIDNNMANILNSNLKLISYIEQLNINNDELKKLLNISKFKMNKYLLTKTNDNLNKNNSNIIENNNKNDDLLNNIKKLIK